MDKPQRYRFSKEEKLKSRKLIEQLFADSKSVSSFPLKLLYIKENEHRFIQAGVTVSGRSFKRAVDRNRIKRMIREAYRLQKFQLEEKLLQESKQLALFFIYTSKDMSDYKTIETACGNIIRKLLKQI